MRPRRPMRAGGRCWRCGYDLSGLPRKRDRVRCTECGARNLEVPEDTRLPWPPWWSVLVQLCWPGGLLALIGAMGVAQPLVLVALGPIGLTLVLAAPLDVSEVLAARHASHHARTSAALWVVSLFLNLLLTVAGVGLAMLFI